jgi:hypothetical protein
MEVSLPQRPGSTRGNSEATVFVSVKDNTGKPVTDAQVKPLCSCPRCSDGHGCVRRQLSWKGSQYVGTAEMPTSGTGLWKLAEEARHSGFAGA